MPGRNEQRTCTLCNHQIAWRPVSFIADNKLWRVEIPLCIQPDCLLKRDAVWIDYLAEKRYGFEREYPKAVWSQEMIDRNTQG
jgi:hypothetical protein